MKLKKLTIIFTIVTLAAILGSGFFIKKYLNLNFFWSKNLSNKKEIDLKNTIEKLQTNLNEHKNYKQKLMQTIQNQKFNIEKLQQLIAKKDKKIIELEDIPDSIKLEKSTKILNSDSKYEQALWKYREVKEQIKRLFKKISDSDRSQPKFKLLLTLASANKRFAALDRTMQQLAARHYIVDKRKKPKWLKINKEVKERIDKQIKKIKKNLNINNNLLFRIEALIQSLTLKISDKQLELNSLKIN